MSNWGIAIFLIFLAWYLITKRKYPFLAFLSGVGAGILVGSIWAYILVMNSFP